MGITEQLITWFVAIINGLGYTGVAFLMMLESMVAPVPSEAVMPFAGFLIYQETFSWVGVGIASTLGSIVGSLLSYVIGALAGRPLIRRLGKYVLLNEHHLDATHRFFERRGEKTVFFSRFIPVVRHLISLPAGAGRMNLAKFLLYTAFGAALWNLFLAWLGVRMGINWEVIHRYSGVLDIFVLIALVALLVYFIRRRLRSRTSSFPPA